MTDATKDSPPMRHEQAGRAKRRRRGLAVGLGGIGLLVTAIIAPLAWSTTADSWIDPTYGTNGSAVFPQGTDLPRTGVDGLGRAVVASEDGATPPHATLRRFTTAGALDATFGTGGVLDLPAIPDQMFVGTDGTVTTADIPDSGQGVVLHRWTGNGQDDQQFGAGGEVTVLPGHSLDGFPFGMAQRQDGDIVLAPFDQTTIPTKTFVVAVTPTGSLDPTWADSSTTPGVLEIGGLMNGLGTDANMVVTSGFLEAAPGSAIFRYTPTGDLDASFGSAGRTDLPDTFVPQDMTVIAGGPYYASGEDTNQAMGVVRLLADGAIDTSFGSNGLARGPAGDCAPTGHLTVAAPSGIYLLGTHADCGGSPLLVDRFTNTGTLDSAFGTAGELAVAELGTESVLRGWGIGPQPNGQVLAYVETVTGAPTYDPTGHVIRLLTSRAGSPGPIIDTIVSADVTTGSGTVSAPPLTTAGSGELLVAAIAADGRANARQRVTNVTGGGLSWTLAIRASDNYGTSEIWQAYSATRFSGAVTATLSKPGFHASVTVMAIAGAGHNIAATAGGTGNTNHPQVTLTTTHANSLAVAVGHDGSAAAPPTPNSGQIILHQFVDTAAGHTMWVQSTNAPVPTPRAVTIGASAPGKDRWELAAVEVPSA